MKTMNTQTILVFTMLFGSIVLKACTERIEIELDNTYARTVIYGSITTDTTAHKITITSTGDYFRNIPPVPISGADVRIWDGEITYGLTEDPDVPGDYYTEGDAFGIPGKTYTLLVDNVDLLGDGNLTSYEAMSELLPVANIDSIRFEYRLDWQGWVVQAFAKDPPDTKDFYKFLITLNDELLTDSLRNIRITDDTFFNGSYTNGVVIYYFNERYGLVQPGDILTVAFCGITKDYYNFIIEAQSTSRPSAPLFSGPPANPRTNISNEAIGYFSAYSISRASTLAVGK